MPWLITLVLLYLAYCGVLFFFQNKLIFPASMAGQPNTTLPTQRTEVIMLETKQGTTVAWFVPAPDAYDVSPAPLAMFFHGNAELIDHQRGIIDLYHGLGMNVLMVEYRGYGHSEGTPSQQHIVADSVAVLNQVLERGDVDADKLVLHGRSIGGGLATQVALKCKPSALIVESTFTSVTDMARRYGIPPFVVKSPLSSIDAFEQLDMPILIMHGWEDQIIPPKHAKQLFNAAPSTRLVMFDAHHNNLPTPQQAPLYHQSIQDMLNQAGLVQSSYWKEQEVFKPAQSSRQGTH